MTTISEKKQIQNLIRRTIIESVQGIFSDPDYGMEVRENIAKRLKKHTLSRTKNKTSLADMKKKFSIK